MGTAAQRTKTRAGRAKAVPARQPRGGETPEDRLDAIFAALPEVSSGNGGVPEVVRRNRRGRAKQRLLDAIASRGNYPVPETRWNEVRTLAERWAQRDFDDAFAEVVELEIRCAEERAVLDAEARGDEDERFAAAERAYRRSVVERYGRIEIRGLQLSARVYQELEIAYVPLHVTEMPGAVTKAQKSAEAQMLLWDLQRTLATDALAKHPRLLLVGGPGSGKSTLIAYLATHAAGGELAREVGWETAPIPFVVPVRALRDAPKTIESMASAAGVEPWLMESAMRRGEALLLLDGLDEARAEVAGAIVPALTRILDGFPSARVLVTTRPVGASGREPPVLPGFARAQLAAMTRDEVDTFIDKWCLAAERSLGKPQETARAEARAAAEDLKSRVHARRAIEKLAQTPLMCSVICIVHRFLGQQIPERRVVLYEAITNVLLHEWDRAKFPDGAAIGKLDATAKRALLSKLARTMHDAKVAELSEEEIVKRFAAQLPDLGQPAGNARAIVEEIRDRSGVLVERAPGSFAFSHLTFQEYLTALEMVRTGAYYDLVDHYEDGWWHETIVLAAGFPNADTVEIIKGLLDRDGHKVAAGTMLAAQCIETAVELPVSLRKTIETRVARLIPPKGHKEEDRLLALGDVVGPLLVREIERVAPQERAGMLAVLGHLGYEPAIGVIGRHLGIADEASYQTELWRDDRHSYTLTKISEHAALAAHLMLVDTTSDLAFRGFMQAIHQADSSVARYLEFAYHSGFNKKLHNQIRDLLKRYAETNPKRAASASRSPKRAARSG